MEYKTLIKSKYLKIYNDQITINIFFFLNTFINIYKYLKLIIIIILNIYLLFNLIGNYKYPIKNDNNNNIIRKINDFIIICTKGKLMNNIPKNVLSPKITGLIIVYNSENTILSSIRSIQNQNMSEIEILIIDDFSIDNTLKIINVLQKNDPRIKIIKNKLNKGSLYSRSIGALNSKGKYIMALDSDDLFINKNIFNICYKESEFNKLDIVEFSGFQLKKKIIKLNNKFPKIALYLRDKHINQTLKQPQLFNSLYLKNRSKIIKLTDAYIWGKCINSQIYKKALNILGEHIYTSFFNYGEDRIVNFIFFKIANTFKFINEYGIIYYYNPLSVCNSFKKELIAHDELLNLMNIYNFTKNSSDLEIIVYELKHRWKKTIKPGLNYENKNYTKRLINLLLISKYIKKKDKKKLNEYLNNLE